VAVDRGAEAAQAGPPAVGAVRAAVPVAGPVPVGEPVAGAVRAAVPVAGPVGEGGPALGVIQTSSPVLGPRTVLGPGRVPVAGREPGLAADSVAARLRTVSCPGPTAFPQFAAITASHLGKG
jgi:hypothetical protein